jgi:hypothetical protein
VKIRNLTHENYDDKSRVSADIIWEDSDRSGLKVFFETSKEYPDALYAGPEPFLVPCLLPAMEHGEKRIQFEGEICPDLLQNLNTAISLLLLWFYEKDQPPIAIEGAKRLTPRQPATPERAGFFLSGGVDCLGTLQSNHAIVPRNHPAAIRDGLIIYGQNLESDVRSEIFQQACTDLSLMAREKDVTLIPVFTNVRLIDDSRIMFYLNHGAILGSVAHAFSNRLTRVYISASDSIPGLAWVHQHNLKPHGSHPLLDPLFSSYAMTIKHDGIAMTRLDKIRLISQWDTALQQIKVCGPNWPGGNCCRCEKCVRTMLGCLAAGVLHKTKAFSVHDVTAEMISKIKIEKPVLGYSVDDDYLELIEPLERIGRRDLVNAILAMIDRSFYPGKNLSQKIHRLDEKYLDGSLARIRKRLTTRNSMRQNSNDH